MAIIQGSNSPIILDSAEDLTDVSVVLASLYNNKILLKEWDAHSIVSEPHAMTLPLKETETLEFPCCVARLEVKYLTKDNKIQLAEPILVKIDNREDKRTLL